MLMASATSETIGCGSVGGRISEVIVMVISLRRGLVLPLVTDAISPVQCGVIHVTQSCAANRDGGGDRISADACSLAALVPKIQAAQDDAGWCALELPRLELARRALFDPVAQPQEL